MNVLAIFVAVGYFLFVAQYLQLVIGLSPLAAGLLSVPSAIGFIIGSNPRAADRPHRPAGLPDGRQPAVAAGLGVLTQVGGSDGLAIVVLASIVISLGLAPVFGLTTELIVGSAPPERASAARASPRPVPSWAARSGSRSAAASGSRSTAATSPGPCRATSRPRRPRRLVTRSGRLSGSRPSSPATIGATVVTVARDAFVQGMQVAATVGAVVAVGVAILTLVALRDVEMHPDAEEADGASQGADRDDRRGHRTSTPVAEA